MVSPVAARHRRIRLAQSNRLGPFKPTMDAAAHPDTRSSRRAGYMSSAAQATILLGLQSGDRHPASRLWLFTPSSMLERGLEDSLHVL